MKAVEKEFEKITALRESNERSEESLLKEIEKEISIRQQLEEVKEVISLSYIAKKYFGKSRQWLNNRINGCIVNGKPCKFSEEEKEKLNYALSDVSKLLGSIRIL